MVGVDLSQFKTDNGGLALKINDAKISLCSASTWNTRLSQIGNIKLERKIIICTYSLPNIEYMRKIFDKRSENMYLIAHEKFKTKADIIHSLYPNIKICLRPNVHAKYVLIEPETVWLSSANFGSSGWLENTIGIHSKEAYEYYEKGTFYMFFREEDEKNYAK